MPPSSQGSPPSPKPTAQAATALTIRDGVIGATIVIGATDAAVSARAPTRRRITEAEFHSLAKGGSLTEGQVYVGRGGRGAVPSKWGNPFRVGAGCTRKEGIDKYKNYVKDAGLDDDIHEITGKDLLCHCRPRTLAMPTTCWSCAGEIGPAQWLPSWTTGCRLGLRRPQGQVQHLWRRSSLSAGTGRARHEA